MKTFRLKLEGPGRGMLFIDGEEQRDVLAVKVETRVSTPNIVTVEYLALRVDIEGEADVTSISDAAKKIAP